MCKMTRPSFNKMQRVYVYILYLYKIYMCVNIFSSLIEVCYCYDVISIL